MPLTYDTLCVCSHWVDESDHFCIDMHTRYMPNIQYHGMARFHYTWPAICIYDELGMKLRWASQQSIKIYWRREAAGELMEYANLFIAILATGDQVLNICANSSACTANLNHNLQDLQSKDTIWAFDSTQQCKKRRNEYGTLWPKTFWEMTLFINAIYGLIYVLCRGFVMESAYQKARYNKYLYFHRLGAF